MALLQAGLLPLITTLTGYSIGLALLVSCLPCCSQQNDANSVLASIVSAK
jgi:hypothetical protein